MGIRAVCPNGHRLHVKSFLGGRLGICPHCEAKFRIPLEGPKEKGVANGLNGGLSRTQSPAASSSSAFRNASVAPPHQGASLLDEEDFFETILGPTAAPQAKAAQAVTPQTKAPKSIPVVKIATQTPVKKLTQRPRIDGSTGATSGSTKTAEARSDATPSGKTPSASAPASPPKPTTGHAAATPKIGTTPKAVAPTGSPLATKAKDGAPRQSATPSRANQTRPVAKASQAATPAALPQAKPPPSAPPPDPIASAPKASWFVRPTTDGQQYGPADGATLREWLKQGRISETTLLWREGWEQWKSASGVFPELTPIPSIQRSTPPIAPPVTPPGPVQSTAPIAGPIAAGHPHAAIPELGFEKPSPRLALRQPRTSSRSIGIVILLAVLSIGLITALVMVLM